CQGPQIFVHAQIAHDFSKVSISPPSHNLQSTIDTLRTTVRIGNVVAGCRLSGLQEVLSITFIRFLYRKSLGKSIYRRCYSVVKRSPRIACSKRRSAKVIVPMLQVRLWLRGLCSIMMGGVGL
ncbi:uncharacterized protein LOC111391033, partial [Olea europaea var. sylvestris]|uniref:uncharacterized protein LOC111391033 n=1 Tax=Olea europaea var. sylvestris TaxID=158386 RepID=UPI000C1D3CEA